MSDYSDSDDEFGAMIYQSSLTAKRHQQAEQVEVAAEQAEDKVDGTKVGETNNVNTLQTNNNNQHFPYKLHSILEYAHNSPTPSIHNCIKWNIDNKSFTIYNKEILINEIVGLFSKQTKFRSFVSLLLLAYILCILAVKGPPRILTQLFLLSHIIIDETIKPMGIYNIPKYKCMVTSTFYPWTIK